MANIYSFKELRDKLQSSDYCPKCRCFFLIENWWKYGDEESTLLESVMLPKYEGKFCVRRAKREDLDDFLTDYWDGNVDWDGDTVEIKKAEL